MPAAVAAIGSVVGSAAAAVGSAVAGIAGAIGSAVSGVVSVVGGIVGSTIGTIVSGVGGVISLLGNVGKLVTDTLSFDLAKIGKDIAGFAGQISSQLTSAIKAVTVPATKIITEKVQVFRTMYETVTRTINNVAYPILNPIKETLETVKGVVDAVKAPVEAVLEPVKVVRQTISDIASLKIIGDVLKGTASVSDLLGGVAEGKTAETAAAIAELTKAIGITTVSTMDKIDTEFELLEATIDSFDERLSSSVAEYAALAKADMLEVVTPKLNYLGDNQQKVTAAVARLARHLEDEGWFAAMLIKVLR